MIKQHALKIGLLFHLVKFAHHMSIWGENAFCFFLEAPVEDNGRSFGGRDFEIPCVCPGF